MRAGRFPNMHRHGYCLHFSVEVAVTDAQAKQSQEANAKSKVKNELCPFPAAVEPVI